MEELSTKVEMAFTNFWNYHILLAGVTSIQTSTSRRIHKSTKTVTRTFIWVAIGTIQFLCFYYIESLMLVILLGLTYFHVLFKMFIISQYELNQPPYSTVIALWNSYNENNWRLQTLQARKNNLIITLNFFINSVFILFYDYFISIFYLNLKWP